MRRIRFLMLLFMTTAIVSWPVIAQADTVSIGLLEGGGSPTTVASGTGQAHVSQSFGTFSNVVVDGQGQSMLTAPDVLFANTINTATSAGGTLEIFVTDQGLTSPSGFLPAFSSFTVNTLPAGWTVVEETFLDPNNGLYGGNPLSMASFSAIGTNAQTTTTTTGSMYSVTELFRVTATGAGDSNLTTDLSLTPAAVGAAEPGSIILLGLGLCGIAMVMRRRYVE